MLRSDPRPPSLYPASRSLEARSPRVRAGAAARGSAARLEPFFRLDLILHEGRGELLTVTNVATVEGYSRAARPAAATLNAGARACDAVLRLLDSAEPNPHAYNLLCRYLRACSTSDAAKQARRRASRRRWPSASSSRWWRASCPGARLLRAAAARPSTSSASRPPPGASSATRARPAPSRTLGEDAYRFTGRARSPGRQAGAGAGGGGADPAAGRAGGPRDARASRPRAACARCWPPEEPRANCRLDRRQRGRQHAAHLNQVVV